jgi:hypothetical protein
MRVGASRPRQTSQGDDKEKNTNSDELTGDSATAGGKEGSAGKNNQRSEDDGDDEQGSG